MKMSRFQAQRCLGRWTSSELALSNDLTCLDRHVTRTDPHIVEKWARMLESRAGQKLRWGPKVTSLLL